VQGEEIMSCALTMHPSQLKDDSKRFRAQPTEGVPAFTLLPSYLSIGRLSVWETQEGTDREGDSNEVDLLEAANKIMNGISDAQLQRVFRSCSSVLKG
jgi:hypothetical protein